jgi:hypothetical protein
MVVKTNDKKSELHTITGMDLYKGSTKYFTKHNKAGLYTLHKT